LLTPAAILHTVIRSLLIIEMLSKSFAAFIFLLALTFFFNAEAIIIPALGASGTKEVSDVIQLPLLKTSILPKLFRQTQVESFSAPSLISICECIIHAHFLPVNESANFGGPSVVLTVQD
jgi:hypothetical protein